MGRGMWRIGDGLRFSRLAPVIAATALATMIGGQDTALGRGQGVAFEVASVKVDTSPLPAPAVSGQRFIGGRFLPDRFVAVYVSLRNLIVMAYDDRLGRRVLNSEIQGGPAWIDSLKFNIDAKFNPSLLETKEGGVPARSLMLRRLLTERFRLRVHFEPRDMTRLELVMARRDRRPGPQLRPASGACVLPTLSAAAERDGGQSSARPPNCPVTMGTSQFAGASLGMDALASMLGARLGVKVVNRTGLDGLFDFALAWTSDERVAAPAVAGESLPSALEEQLGLKLERKRGPVDVLVVDAAERPTAN